MLEYNHKHKIYRHRFIVDNKFVLTHTDNAHVSININSGIWDKPNYNSLNGFRYHVENLISMGVPELVAMLWVQDPELPEIDILYLYENRDKLGAVNNHHHPIIEPFNGDRRGYEKINSMECLRRYLDGNISMPYAKYHSHFEIYKLNVPDYIKDILIEINQYGYRNSAFNSLYKLSFKRKYLMEEIFIYLEFGIIKPSITKWTNKYGIEKLNMISDILHAHNIPISNINFNVDTDDPIQLGIKHKDIKHLYCLDIPKKEKCELIEFYLLDRCNPIIHLMSTHINFMYTFKEIALKYYGFKQNWDDYINYFYVSRPKEPFFLRNLLRFVSKHNIKFSKERIVHGPGGQSAIFYYRTLIERITPEILDRHDRSWDCVIGEIEKIEIEKFRSQFKDPEQPVVQLKGIEIPPHIKPLRKVGEFLEEGEKMKHCVAQYVPVCLEHTIIIHVGQPAPAGATAEISKCGEKFKVHQIQAYDDQPPPTNLKSVVYDFIEILNTNSNKITLSL